MMTDLIPKPTLENVVDSVIEAPDQGSSANYDVSHAEIFARIQRYGIGTEGDADRVRELMAGRGFYRYVRGGRTRYRKMGTYSLSDDLD